MNGAHPPKNKIEYKVHINKILPYSPKKKKAKIIDEYSRLYPATISASASGMSNGALFVSAIIEIKKIIATGHSINMFQTPTSCAYTISHILIECETNPTIVKTSPIETSYEIICAADLNAPKKGYFELLDQPAIMIP